MRFQYPLKCCDIVSPSYIVWKLNPDHRAGNGKSSSSKLGSHTGYFEISGLMQTNSLTVKQRWCQENISVIYARLLLFIAACIMRQNLYLMRYAIGSPWSSFIAGVTSSWYPRFATKRTVACRTFYSRASVIAGRPQHEITEVYPWYYECRDESLHWRWRQNKSKWAKTTKMKETIHCQLANVYLQVQFVIHIDADVPDNSCWLNGSWTEEKTGLSLCQLL